MIKFNSKTGYINDNESAKTTFELRFIVQDFFIIKGNGGIIIISCPMDHQKQLNNLIRTSVCFRIIPYSLTYIGSYASELKCGFHFLNCFVDNFLQFFSLSVSFFHLFETQFYLEAIYI